jgi:tetratricopeptide (TPR) repeat protein/predicted Ser/Thr protein kinase
MTAPTSAVQRIFAGACDLPPAARAAFLAAECGGDEALRAEVETLLALDTAGDADTGFLGERPLQRVRRELTEPSPAMPERIGPFQILSVLGHGGMGVVYRARQTNPDREVALKVLAPGFCGEAARARFALEAKALGRLQHPGIAHIYEASLGTTDHAGPYLAMELVRGEPLLQWHERTRPDTATTLRILLEIADAVQHAHQRGLIHRDLKPGNVFVDDHGRAKVLDFGIARLIDDEVDMTMLTQPGQLLGTLAYMSPEQASGQQERVDVRTDVYSIGVLGYQLLTGRLPIDVNGDALTTGLRRIAEEEPSRLGEHDRSLAGDLQTIFAKALRKEPERRYPSMQALGDDLRRFLAHEPIQARPATATYLLARFARRHRGLVAGTVLAFLALVGGTSAALVWAWRADAAAVRATAAETKARDEARIANRVLRFVEGLFSAADPEVAQGRTITAKDLVAKGTTDLQAELADEPLLRARLAQFLGTVQSQMGDARTALPLVEEALTTLRRELPPDDPRIAEAVLSKARCLFVGRDPAAALPLFAEALALHEAAGRPQDAFFARCHEGLGACSLDTNDSAAALRHYTIVQQVRAADPDPDVRAGDLVRLANVHSRRGTTEQAEALFAEAHTLLQQGNDPMLAGLVATNLGVLRVNQQRPGDAETLFREALAHGELHFGADHPLLIRRLCNVAGVLSMTGRTAEAAPLLERALALGERGGAQFDDGVANVAMNLGNVRMDQGDAAGALVLYERAAVVYERLGGPRSPDLVEALENQVRAQEELGQSEAADALRDRLDTIRGK